MKIEYLPNVGFVLNSIPVNWGEERHAIRKKLRDRHKEDDRVIKTANYFDGDESRNIVKKRDIYKNFGSDNDYFFLNYNEEEKLKELEVHWGIDINVKESVLEFETPIEQLFQELKKYGSEIVKLGEGNYFLPELKMTIASDESMGGEGDGMSYFYAASDVTHLIK